MDIQEELQKTVVFITHDLDEALRLGDRIAILRDGAVIQQGTGQEIVLNPADGYISDFVRDVNRGRIIEVDTIMKSVETPSDALIISSGSMLEDAAKKLSESGALNARIVDATGKHLGSITIHDTIDAMVTPSTH